MGSPWGDSAGGGTPEAAPDGEPEPIEIELLADEALPEDGPNAAASGLETIGGGATVRSRIARLPRALRVAGALAAAAALALVVWPAPGRQQAVPPPRPMPTGFDADLYKIRFIGTTLKADDGADHAVLRVALVNDARAPLDIGDATLYDAIGLRIGTSATWPPGTVGAQTVVSVPLVLPFACDSYGRGPVLPASVRLRVSALGNTDAHYDYHYEVLGGVWDMYAHARTAYCGGKADSLNVSSIDTTQYGEGPGDRNSFDLTFSFEVVGAAAWSVDTIATGVPGATVTTTDLPLALGPGQSGTVTTRFHVADCAAPPTWPPGSAGLEYTARKSGPTPDSGGAGGDQSTEMVLSSDLLSTMVHVACKH